MERKSGRIVVLGAGNVGWHLAPALAGAGEVVQIWSRSIENARALAERIPGAEATDRLESIERSADLYIIAVKDDVIEAVAKTLKGVKGIVAHTSGSFSLEQLQSALPDNSVGVFYPFQTFSKNSPVDFSTVPFFIEGNCEATTQTLSQLAKNLSEDVREADSSIRQKLHIAAVFACNFTNFLWDLADTYLKENSDMDIKIMQPLLSEMYRKAMILGPHASQTGPAVRNDKNIIEKHLSQLDPEKAEIYRFITDQIIKYHK